MARQNFSDHVTDKLAIAKRQNEQVYHDSIPQIDTLELISGMPAVATAIVTSLVNVRHMYSYIH